jgi:Calpain family cysteine protease
MSAQTTKSALFSPPSSASPKFSHYLQICRDNQAIFRDPRASVYSHRLHSLREIVSKPVIFSDKSTALTAGLDTPSYLSSAIHALATRIPVLQRLFANLWVPDADDAHDKFGIYAVWINLEGCWKEILVDDRFPFLDIQGELALACLQSGDRTEFWPSLLEKAYFQGLSSIGIHDRSQGNPYNALRDLTGSPYSIYKDIDQTESFMMKVKSALHKNWLVVLLPNSHDKLSIGLPEDEVCVVMKFITVKDQTLIKLKHPRNADKFRNIVTFLPQKNPHEFREELESIKFEEGEFLVGLSQLPQIFTSYGIYVMQEDATYVSMPITKLETFKGSEPSEANPVRELLSSPFKQSITEFNSSGPVSNKSQSESSTCYLFSFKLPEKRLVTISLDQQDQRRLLPYCSSSRSEYPYSLHSGSSPSERPLLTFTRLTVSKHTTSSLLFVDSRLSASQSTFITDELPAGRYLIFVEEYGWQPRGVSKYLKPVNLGVFCKGDDINIQKLDVPRSLFLKLEYLVWKDFSLHNIGSAFEKLKLPEGKEDLVSR